MYKIKGRQFGFKMLFRGICSQCGEEAFVCGDLTSSCCSAPIVPNEKGEIVQECSSDYIRKKPPVHVQKEILVNQNNQCYWCEKEFGSWVSSPAGAVKQLTAVWDHYIPYWYTGSSKGADFVASCNNCNSYKSGKIILTEEDETTIKQYVRKRFFDKGWNVLD